jgi:hypothetical protein
VGEELVGEDGGVCVDFDDVDGDGGHFCEHGATQRVGKGEIDGGEAEIYSIWLCLWTHGLSARYSNIAQACRNRSGQAACRDTHISHCDLRALRLDIHILVIHLELLAVGCKAKRASRRCRYGFSST